MSVPLENFTYKDENYEFAFVKPNEAFQKSLVVRPKHLKVLINKTDMDEEQLKVFIVDDWFGIENEQIKEARKAKREAKREAKKH